MTGDRSGAIPPSADLAESSAVPRPRSEAPEQWGSNWSAWYAGNWIEATPGVEVSSGLVGADAWR